MYMYMCVCVCVCHNNGIYNTVKPVLRGHL